MEFLDNFLIDSKGATGSSDSKKKIVNINDKDFEAYLVSKKDKNVIIIGETEKKINFDLNAFVNSCLYLHKLVLFFILQE